MKEPRISANLGQSTIKAAVCAATMSIGLQIRACLNTSHEPILTLNSIVIAPSRFKPPSRLLFLFQICCRFRYRSRFDHRPAQNSLREIPRGEDKAVVGVSTKGYESRRARVVTAAPQYGACTHSPGPVKRLKVTHAWPPRNIIILKPHLRTHALRYVGGSGCARPPTRPPPKGQRETVLVRSVRLDPSESRASSVWGKAEGAVCGGREGQRVGVRFQDGRGHTRHKGGGVRSARVLERGGSDTGYRSPPLVLICCIAGPAHSVSFFATTPNATLTVVVGDKLLLPPVVERMIDNDESWEVVRTFRDKNVSLEEASEQRFENSSLLETHRRCTGRERKRVRSSSPPSLGPMDGGFGEVRRPYTGTR
ncbi:hypothetical protein EVAR_24288_1 [Eumeta japonica]|uniref:Uncharacterized protein n=1 Tax=Eumeta variegata TaxID=151549 RepID=A0A4C1VEA1_EUMVA|nr:hypothetical protein EVAR_24288_1 [Eumeta japonica]